MTPTLRSAWLVLGWIGLADPAAAQDSNVIPSPPTAADKARWAAHRRDLPTPEILQPTLDAALPDYAPPRPPEW